MDAGPCSQNGLPSDRFKAPCRLFVGLLLCAVVARGSPQARGDAVTLHHGITIRGTVVHYDEETIEIQPERGPSQRYSLDQVRLVELDRCEGLYAGQQAVREGRFSEGLTILEPAYAQETRTWARRRLAALLIQAHSALGNYGTALAVARRAVEQDGAGLGWHQVPIWWLPEPPRPEAAVPATQALQSPSTPLAVAGASHLLALGEAPVAERFLVRLADSPDLLARTYARSLLLVHRKAEVSLREGPRSLKDQLLRLPPYTRAGPHFTLALLLERSQQVREAVFEYLRVALVYGADQYRLAAHALWRAAQLLEKLGRSKEASLLYTELKNRYSHAPEATLAVESLRSSEGKTPP
jgi:tetratricopeptide (TPR) repeat protein